MNNLITYKSAKELDILSQEKYLIPSLSLMESAARCFYSAIKDKLINSKLTIFVAGSGNNGADSLAVARMAYCDGIKNINIYFVPGHQSKENKVQYDICKALEIPFTDNLDSELIVDGLIGVGFSGELSQEKRNIVDGINKANYIISIDCPSGLKEDGQSYCVKANETITFGYEKVAFYIGSNINYVGKITTLNPSFPLNNISLSDNYRRISYSDINLRKINDREYKNKKGHVAIVGGSKEYSGAVRLSERAAFKCGAGLVTVFTSPEIYEVVAKENLSPIVKRFEDLQSSNSYDSLLIGPGLTDLSGEEVIKLISLFNSKCVVVDAGAIKLLGENCNAISDNSNIIITPHLGEFRALLATLNIDSSDTLTSLIAVSKALKGATIVLKSSITIIYQKGMFYFLNEPNPALGVAGSGDVLAGLIACLKDPIQGVLLHSLAGRSAHERFGFFTSEELIDEVGRIR